MTAGADAVRAVVGAGMARPGARWTADRGWHDVDQVDAVRDPDPDCYACRGTGRVVGFGMHGAACPCIGATGGRPMTAAYGPVRTRCSVLGGYVLVDDAGRDVGAVTPAVSRSDAWNGAAWSTVHRGDAWRAASAVSRSAAIRAAMVFRSVAGVR